MPAELVLPRLSPSMQDATVLEWQKKEGDSIAKDEIVLMIETEKASLEVEALTDGVLYKILAQPGDVVLVDKPLAVIRLATDTLEDLRQYGSSTPPSGVMAEQTASPLPNQPPSTADRRIRTSPLARRLAESRGIDLSLLPAGSGPDGRITEQDVLAYREPAAHAASVPITGDGDRRLRLTDHRRHTINALRQSKDKTIPVTSVTEIDLTALLELHRQVKPVWVETHQVKLTLNAFFVKAVALALRQHEILNSTLDDTEILLKASVNVGLAMHVNDGLYVPVIKNADRLSVLDIAQSISALRNKCEHKTIALADMADGTFTITNVGPFDVLFSTPVIVYPQVGILGIGVVKPRPVFEGETIVKRHLCNFSLTYDHRVVDGAPAASFRQTLQRLLERPASLLS